MRACVCTYVHAYVRAFHDSHTIDKAVQDDCADGSGGRAGATAVNVNKSTAKGISTRDGIAQHEEGSKDGFSNNAWAKEVPMAKKRERDEG